MYLEKPLVEMPPGFHRLAYLDTLAGLVPLVMIKLERAAATGRLYATARVTTARGVYRRGEVLCRRSGQVVPRCAVRHRHRGWIDILPNFSWYPTKENADETQVILPNA